jgi:hypothetical protein
MRVKRNDLSRPGFILRCRSFLTGTRMRTARMNNANGESSFPKSHGSMLKV